jgi:hypothetical protein
MEKKFFVFPGWDDGDDNDAQGGDDDNVDGGLVIPATPVFDNRTSQTPGRLSR